MFRKRRLSLIVLCLLILFFTVPILLTWRLVRRTQRNQALIAAIKENNTRAALTLLEQGADADARDEPHLKLLDMLWASLHPAHGPTGAAPTALQLLLGEGRQNIPDYVPPMNMPLLQALLVHGADANIKDPKGNDPLHLAVHYGYSIGAELQEKYAVELLLNHGAKINSKDEDEETVLMSMTDDRDLTRLLLRHGADVHVRDNLGCTALHHVAEFGSAKVAADLLKAGAEIDAKTAYGTTPLMLAALKRNMEIFKLLIRKGANVHIKDYEGKSVIGYAATAPGTLYAVQVEQNGGHDPEGEEFIRLLKAAGAKE